MALAGAATGISARPLSSTALARARAYRPDIDGLRALAILSVVLNHAGVPGLSGGFTGVDIFFAISGYLIGGHIHTELRQAELGHAKLGAGRFSYLDFYRRRAKRILPAFFAVLLFTLSAGLVLLSPSELARLARSAFAATLSGSNILFWHGANYFDVRSELNPLLMTWSLGVEEQFYAVIPLGMVLLARMRRGWMLRAILIVCPMSFLFSWAALKSYPTLVFYMLPARAWELGIGVALAVVEASRDRAMIFGRWRKWASAAAMALMIAPLFLLSATSRFPGPAALPSVAGAALAIATPESWMSRNVLSLRPIVFVGRISYSWYLWHWPLLSLLRIVYGGALPTAISLCAIAVSFAFATLSYLFIEKPFRESRRAPGSLLVRYAAAGAVILGVCCAVWLSRGVPQRFPELARMESANAALAADACLADDGSDRPNSPAQCLDSSGARPVIALWGDSHAAALAPGLRELANARGYGFAELAKASCPPVIGAAHFVPRHPRLAAECLRFNRAVIEGLAGDVRIRVVVLHAAWAGYLHRDWQDGWLVGDLAQDTQPPTAEQARAVLEQSLAAAIRSLRVTGKQVIVVDDIPSFDFEPQWRIDTARIPARRGLAEWLRGRDVDDTGFGSPGDAENAAAATALLEQTVAEQAGATLVDLKPRLCGVDGRCKYRDGSRVLYLDNNHLSPEGARDALRGFALPAANEPGSSVGRERAR